jgi:hypothetical protein
MSSYLLLSASIFEVGGSGVEVERLYYLMMNTVFLKDTVSFLL